MLNQINTKLFRFFHFENCGFEYSKLVELSRFTKISSRFEIWINTNISILKFNGYIKNIMDILTKISIEQKLFKIHENV